MPPSVSCASSNGVLRVAVFGSYYRGFYVLNELLFGPLRERVKVVGVATDDTGSSFIKNDTLTYLEGDGNFAYLLGSVCVFFTAYYSFRLLFLTFLTPL
jgi:hypothetical protein